MTDDEAFYGREALRQGWQEARVKGSLIASRRRYLDEVAPAAVGKIRSTISEEARRFLDLDFSKAGRYACVPFVELDRAIVEHVMAGDVAQMERFGEQIAMSELGAGAFGGLVRLAGGHLSLRVYSAAYRLYWSPGRVRFSSRDGARETMVLEGLVLPRYMCRYGFTGYVRGLLRSAKDAREVSHACVHDDESLERCTWVVAPTGG